MGGLGVLFFIGGVVAMLGGYVMSGAEFGSDTSNLGLLNMKTGVEIIGAALTVSGATLMGAGHIAAALRRSGEKAD